MEMCYNLKSCVIFVNKLSTLELRKCLWMSGSLFFCSFSFRKLNLNLGDELFDPWIHGSLPHSLCHNKEDPAVKITNRLFLQTKEM